MNFPEYSVVQTWFVFHLQGLQTWNTIPSPCTFIFNSPNLHHVFPCFCCWNPQLKSSEIHFYSLRNSCSDINGGIQKWLVQKKRTSIYEWMNRKIHFHPYNPQIAIPIVLPAAGYAPPSQLPLGCALHPAAARRERPAPRIGTRRAGHFPSVQWWPEGQDRLSGDEVNSPCIFPFIKSCFGVVLMG